MSNNTLETSTLLDKLEAELKQLFSARKLTQPLMIGIHSGGALVAKELHQRLAIEKTLGIMDISFYRDDFSQTGINSKAKPSQLPMQMENQDIILIDDVFYTGRTARAALNEIFDYGRPNQVILAVLIERYGRQVPLRPDCSGGTITLAKDKSIKLTGPDPLTINVKSLDTQLSAT
ncbi:MAG: bifunctional pyr operon transcriptional regulator/uracil phosphoribosyltransferase PyrR [Methylococcales symbiont of Iophon sp. n. MRB-2018]|nr:MAG: bifunctional pyr operon transcriptional regulator/uracil phosphoribosyltransferase PyrR [Methylococcales symbiont of Iophon sp. n. MRB-2018]KAF3980381.1 MAG: bifunctional pyr operon transcriptional regulator/uracil phosphoribosyltransferase PyrR [Methylococcales symbiont of Iophon sp. n. MRB-2018]